MQSLVVFFALASVACGSIIPWAQPAHHAALVLDPHGRPLDTAAVLHARAIHLQAKALEPVSHAAIAPLVHSAVVAAPIAHAVVAAPAAVSHQSRVDVHSSPAAVAHTAPVLAAAPVFSAHGLAAHGLAAHGLAAHGHAAPLLGYSAHGLAGHGHLLKKRSLGHLAYSAPLVVAPSAVSHQSRVDVVSSPAIVSHHAIAAPVVSHAVAAPVLTHAIAPAAVSHQSRVDVRSNPAITIAAAPLLHAAPWAHGAGHLVHGW
ncbi:unnamed protein product, partial [Brenthis ino]